MDFEQIIGIAQRLEGLSLPVLGIVALLVLGRYFGPALGEHLKETLKRKREGKTINGVHEEQLKDIQAQLKTSTNHNYHEMLQALERIDGHVVAGNKMLEDAVRRQGEMYGYLQQNIGFIKGKLGGRE